jgi:hypothetical protein
VGPPESFAAVLLVLAAGTAVSLRASAQHRAGRIADP